MKRLFSSLTLRLVLGRALGVALVLAAGLSALYFGVRHQVYNQERDIGVATVEMLEDIIMQEPELLKDSGSAAGGRLQAAIEDFAGGFNNIERINIINSRMVVIADTEKRQLGRFTDQTQLIEIMQNPVGDVEPFIYEKSGQKYMRLVRNIHGSYDPVLRTDVSGAVVMDIPLSHADEHIQNIFAAGAAISILLFSCYFGIEFLLLRRSVLRPVYRLQRDLGKIGDGITGVRTPIAGTREMGDVTRAFNNMAARIENAEAVLREKTATLNNIILSSPQAMMQVDTSLIVRMWNPAAEQIFGFSREEALGSPLKIVPPEKEAEFKSLFASLKAGGVLVNVETQRLSKDGKLIYVNLSATPLYSTRGEVTGYSAVMADITRVKEAEMEMEESNRSLAASVAALKQHTHELNLLSEMGELLQSCTIVEEAYHVVTRMMERIFPDMPGVLYEIMPSRDQMLPRARWGKPPIGARATAANGCWSMRRGRAHLVEDLDTSLLCTHVNEVGEPYPYLCIPLLAQGEALGILHLRYTAGTTAPMEEKQKLGETVAEQVALALSNLKLRESLHQQSIRDPLTGLFNRRYLDDTLPREVERARRQNLPLSVIMIDIDFFKRFNDDYGHKAGDMALQALGEFLLASVRAEDIACRYGGEEFTLVLPGATLEIAQERAEQVREGIQMVDIMFEGRKLEPLRLSLGISVFPENGTRSQELIMAADAALYRAKEKGRDRLELAS